MRRPHITLHIFTSLDGKITGDFGNTKKAKEASKIFQELGFSDHSEAGFNFDGWIYGRITSETYFASKGKPQLDPQADTVPADDYVINENKKRYYISIDRSGKVNWTKNTATYAGQEASVIEIITERATNSYRAFLRKNKVPYLICGKDQVDFDLMLKKLSDYYHLKNLLLGGGGILNWSMIEQGLCDEISLIVAPSADGNDKDARLFNSSYLKDNHALEFTLKSAKALGKNTLWLRYGVDNRRDIRI